MSIADYFANLGNPSARREIVKSAFTGAVKSPGTGTSKATNGSAKFLKFAGDRQQSATALATEAGFEPPLSTGAGPADIYRATMLERGYPEHVVEGMMMNVYDESGGNPAAIGDNGAAGGMAQWNGPRFEALKSFAAAQGTTWQDPRTQALFNDHELKTTERGAYEAMMRTANAGEAGAAFLNLYERPAEVHRSRREAKYLGGDGNTSDFTDYSGGLSFGAELSEPNPLADEYIGRSAKNYSMGMDSAEFKSLAERFGEREAMKILNATAPGSAPPSDDPIMKFLQEGADEAQLANGGVDLGGAGGLSMGVPVADDSPAASTGGGGASPTTASTKGAEDAPKVTAVDRMMNAIYGTSVEDMDDDERADRRRAVGQAMTQGFQMLSRGTPMNIEPIVQQRMELQQTRRAAADLKNNAQGVSDMLVAAGMDEMAQLPFMGENGMNAALQTLATVATRSPEDGQFDVSPAMRATMAQTLSDMGYEGPAQLIMNTEAGPAFEEVWNSAVGATTRASTGEGGSSAPPLSPEKRTAAAGIARTQGNEVAARMIEEGVMSDSDISKYALESGKVMLGAQEAGGVAAAQADVDLGKGAAEAASLASGMEIAGADPRLVKAVKEAGSYEAGKFVYDAQVEAEKAAAERAAVQASGAALAEAVPDDLANSAEIKDMAKKAVTDGDRQRVYEMIAEDPKTTEQRNYELAKSDPGYLKFVFDLKRAESGQQTYSISEQLNIKGITAFSEQMAATQASRIEMQSSVDTIRSVVADPDYTMGPVQGVLLNTYQEWANSILGDEATQFRSEDNLTADAIIEQVQNKLFAAATADLKGAVSDRETGYARATLVATSDLKLQALAKLQMMEMLPKIQEAEYNAMLEWTEQAEKSGTLGDREGMIKYVNEKVGDMQIFEKLNIDQVDAWSDDPDRKLGDVFMLVNPQTGSTTFVDYKG